MAAEQEHIAQDTQILMHDYKGRKLWRNLVWGTQCAWRKQRWLSGKYSCILRIGAINYPLAQARPRSQKSGQNGESTPTPCLDKAVHARDTRDNKGVGEPSDGDGEGLRMGKSTLSKAALCSISFPFRMYFKWM